MPTLTQTSEPVSDGQVKLITRIISDIADSDPVQEAIKALSKKGAERLKGNAQFAAALRQFAVEKITELGVVNGFANEEVRSKYGYLSGYRKPTSLPDQLDHLLKLFPSLRVASPSLVEQIARGDVKLPQHAEGWFAIPNLAKAEVMKLFGGSYSRAVQTVLDKITETRKGNFHNYLQGQIKEDQIRQSAQSVEFWKQFSEAQGNPDILIIAAQFGLRHRGRSVRRAQVVMEDTSGEIGLGAFHIGIMLLTHPVRLQHYDDLWIDAAGDEFAPGYDGVFSCAPFFRFLDDRVEFDAEEVDDTSGYYGAASGFAPQLKLIA